MAAGARSGGDASSGCDDGEERRIVLSSTDGRVYVVAYTVRERRLRSISAGKANPREQARYAALPT